MNIDIRYNDHNLSNNDITYIANNDIQSKVSVVPITKKYLMRTYCYIEGHDFEGLGEIVTKKK